MYSWKISKEFLQENKWTLLLFLFFTATAYPLESIAVPQLYSKFFENLKQNTSPKKIIQFLVMIAILLSIVKVSDGIIHHIESKLIPQFNEYILNYIYTNLLIKYQNNFTDLELGKIISRINTIPTIMRELSTDITIWVFPKFVAVVIIQCYFFYLNSQLGLVSLIMILIMFAINYYLSKRCIPLSFSRHDLLEKNSEEVQDKLSNLSSIYATGKMKHEIKNYVLGTKKYASKYTENLKCVNTIRYINGVFDIILFLVLNGFTAYLYFKKKISFGILMSIFITVIYFLPCISTISASLPDIVHYMGVLSKTDDFLKEIHGQYKGLESKPSIQLQTGDIEVRNLHFQYENQQALFRNFSLHIPDKQKVCLIGHSGNGKSTLIKLLMGYYQIPENSVFLDSKDIMKYDVNSLRSQISYVNQNNRLFNGTIYENIQYGNQLSKQQIDQLVHKFQIQDIFSNLPDGFNSDCGVQGSNLSGGQKQIIHILRSLSTPKKIIILDEPTSAIDPKNKNTILQVIQELSKQSTLILITHDESIMKICDRVIKMEKGRIVEDKLYQS